jgi:PAS domain S-box-containing protein
MTHFWHADAPADFHHRFQRVPMEENPFQEKLFANQSFVMTSADRLPDRYRFYRERCLAYGVKSLAGVPIFVEGLCIGYVGFVSTGKHRLWTDREIMILRVLSEIFSAAFLRQRIESSLRHREKNMFAFYRETENPVWCFAYHPPIPIHLPVEKQCELIWKSKFEDGNDAAAKLIGLKSKEELIGVTTSDLFGKPTESYQRMLRNYIRDGYRCIDARVEVEHPDGSIRTWLHQGQGVVQDGKLYRSWVSTRDITDHVKTEDSAAKSDDGQYRNSSLTLDEIQAHELMIGKVMNAGQPYLDPNFNLSRLARLARLPDYQVSQVLNMGMKTSFYDLVNRYRIEHLVRLLSSPECKSEGILDLAFRVGFNSKSTFNTAFKKIMGITPSTYRLRIQSRRDSHESPESPEPPELPES